MTDTADLLGLDATGQAEFVRAGYVEPLALANAAIPQIERLNPSINAVITTLYNKVRSQVRSGQLEGPFRGVPLLVKDFLCETAGDPYFEGIAGLRRRGCWSPAPTRHRLIRRIDHEIDHARGERRDPNPSGTHPDPGVRRGP